MRGRRVPLLVLCVVRRPAVGWWVLAIGLARYAFVALGWLAAVDAGDRCPRGTGARWSPRSRASCSWSRRGVLPVPVVDRWLVVALALLAESFGRDVCGCGDVAVGAVPTPGPRRRASADVAAARGWASCSLRLVPAAVVRAGAPRRGPPSRRARSCGSRSRLVALAGLVLVLPDRLRPPVAVRRRRRPRPAHHREAPRHGVLRRRSAVPSTRSSTGATSAPVLGLLGSAVGQRGRRWR